MLTVETIQDLIDRGIDLDSEFKHNSFELYEYINDDDSESDDDDWNAETMMMRACWLDDVENSLQVIRALIKGGADVNYGLRTNGDTALINASCRAMDNPEFFVIVEELLRAGADPEIPDDDGYTPWEYVGNLCDTGTVEQRKKLKKLLENYTRGKGNDRVVEIFSCA